MMKLFSILLCSILTACGGGGGGSEPEAQPVAQQPAAPAQPADLAGASWDIEFSRGVPEHPATTADGFAVDIPQLGGSVHYVTTQTAPLAGKKRVVMCYRVEYQPGTQIVPLSDPSAPSLLTLYFQRQGDSMTARDEAFRWYASFATQAPIAAGEHTVEAPLDANWTAVLTSTRANNPQAYDLALAQTARVGFVLGGGTGLGHGVYATGPARLTVTSFRVE